MTTTDVEQPIEVLQVPSEFEQLRALYRQRQPKRVLEIGSWQGGTLREWLTLGNPELVVAVDPNHQRPELYQGWQKPGTVLVTIAGLSQDRLVQQAVQALGPFDWLFVDGDHVEAAVRKDVRLCVASALPEAVLVLHDIAKGVENQGEPGPRLVFDRLAKQHRTEQFVEEPYGGPWAHGIGVVYL